MPVFEDKVEMENEGSLTNIQSVKPLTLRRFKHFHNFYGPNQVRYKEYLQLEKLVADQRMQYIEMIIEYWFDQREKLK
jgi:hypothetical protein